MSHINTCGMYVNCYYSCLVCRFLPKPSFTSALDVHYRGTDFIPVHFSRARATLFHTWGQWREKKNTSTEKHTKQTNEHKLEWNEKKNRSSAQKNRSNSNTVNRWKNWTVYFMDIRRRPTDGQNAHCMSEQQSKQHSTSAHVFIIRCCYSENNKMTLVHRMVKELKQKKRTHTHTKQQRNNAMANKKNTRKIIECAEKV